MTSTPDTMTPGQALERLTSAPPAQGAAVICGLAFGLGALPAFEAAGPRGPAMLAAALGLGWVSVALPEGLKLVAGDRWGERAALLDPALRVVLCLVTLGLVYHHDASFAIGMAIVTAFSHPVFAVFSAHHLAQACEQTAARRSAQAFASVNGPMEGSR